MNISRICFGTSTFVAGRLMPHKDSEPGLSTLIRAISDGLCWVHSNPALDTQWAVRTAWQRAGRPPLRHIVKVECALDPSKSIHDIVSRSVEKSLGTLDVTRLHAAVLEIDLKGTKDLGKLADTGRVREFYAHAAHEALVSGAVGEAFAYCHSPQHMSAAMRVETVTGLAAQFSPAESWPRIFFPELRTRDMPFLGMAPLWRRRLAVARGGDEPDETTPLVWVLNHQNVTQAVITMSSIKHWEEAKVAIGHRYDSRRERSDFEEWGLAWPPDDGVRAIPISILSEGF